MEEDVSDVRICTAEVIDSKTNLSCLETMQYLVTKHPGGYEGWAEERGEELVIR